MRKTLTDYSIVLFGTGVGRGIAFLNSIVIARTLGKEDFGRFSIFFVVMVLTWMFPQAFDSVFVRYAKTTTDKKQKDEFLRVSFFLKAAYALIALVFAYPIAWILAVKCFNKPEMIMLIVWAIVSGVFQAFLMTIASIFQEREKFNTFAFLYTSYTFAVFVALLSLRLVSAWFTLSNVIIIHVLISVAIGSVSIALLLKQKIKHIWPLDKECMQKSVDLGKWAFGSLVLAFIFTRVDMLFLPRYVSLDVVGMYGVAQQITMLISVMAGSMSNVFLPKACAAIASGETLRKYIKTSMTIVAVIIVAILALMIFAGQAIQLFYGAEYLSGKGVAQILLGGWIFYILFLPFSALFYAFEASRARFFVDAVRFFAAIALLFFLIPDYKQVGAAWGMTIAQILNCVVGFLVLSVLVRRYEWSRSRNG